MKKNLRIVSAAAAALLAVAPVAATAMPVNAAINKIELGNTPAIKGDIVVNSNLVATTKPNTTTINNVTGTATPSDWDGKVNGEVTATLNNKSYTLNLTPSTDANGSVTNIWTKLPGHNELLAASYRSVDKDANGNYPLVPGTTYFVITTNTGFNFGTENANKKDLTVTSSNGMLFRKSGDLNWSKSIKLSTNQNGSTANDIDVMMPVKATDSVNMRSVSFYERANGAEVQNGTLDVNANSNAQLNVQAIVNAFNAKYAAHQLEGGNKYIAANVTTNVKEITEQLKKAGITVDANGYFEAPKTLNLNFEAKSAENAYTATMPVVVNVQNGKEAAAAQEVTKNVTIMHIATIYDKNGKATTEPVLRAYNPVSVVSEPVTINGAKFYKLAGKDQYIKVGNVDGTKRTLKHNSYVYKSNGKAYTHKVGKKTKKVLKRSGSEVTTYGKSFMIRGSQMWRIGKNQYIKVRNF